MLNLMETRYVVIVHYVMTLSVVTTDIATILQLLLLQEDQKGEIRAPWTGVVSY